MTSALDQKGLDAAENAQIQCDRNACDDELCNGFMCRNAIRAYLSTVIPAEIAGMVEEWRKAMEGVTSGPWRSEPHITGISWLIGPTHVERGIGPQGEDLEGVRVVAIAKDTVAQSDWIARCSPDAIASLLTLIERLAASQAETRRQALEEAARICDEAHDDAQEHGFGIWGNELSAAIRALIDQPSTEGGMDGE